MKAWMKEELDAHRDPRIKALGLKGWTVLRYLRSRVGIEYMEALPPYLCDGAAVSAELWGWVTRREAEQAIDKAVALGLMARLSDGGVFVFGYHEQHRDLGKWDLDRDAAALDSLGIPWQKIEGKSHRADYLVYKQFGTVRNSSEQFGTVPRRGDEMRGEESIEMSTSLTPSEKPDGDPVASDSSTSAQTLSLQEFAESVFSNWNLVAEKLGLPVAMKLTQERLDAIRRRVERDKDWPTTYCRALERLPLAKFCFGFLDEDGKPAGWMMSLDEFIKPGRIYKILEGKYDHAQTPRRTA